MLNARGKKFLSYYRPYLRLFIADMVCAFIVAAISLIFPLLTRYITNTVLVSSQSVQLDLIFKIAAIGILVSVLNQVLSRSGRDEQATMTTLAGLVVVLMMVVQQISGLFELVKNLFGL